MASLNSLPSKPQLEVNGVGVSWDHLSWPLSLGASLGKGHKKVLVTGSGHFVDLIAAGVAATGGESYLWRGDVPPELFSFYSLHLGFDSSVRCMGKALEVLVGGRAPGADFFKGISVFDLSSVDWKEVYQWSTVSFSGSSYVGKFAEAYAELRSLGLKPVTLGGSSPSARPTAEVLASLGVRAITAENAENLPLDLYFAEDYVWPAGSSRTDVWSAVASLASAVRGDVVVGIDAPWNLDEELYKSYGTKVKRTGLTLNDLSSAGNYAVAADSDGHFLAGKVHYWKDAPMAALAYALGSSSPFKPLPRLEERLDRVAASLEALDGKHYEGWGWRAVEKEVGGVRVLFIERNGGLRVVAEGSDREGVRSVLQREMERARS